MLNLGSDRLNFGLENGDGVYGERLLGHQVFRQIKTNSDVKDELVSYY